MTPPDFVELANDDQDEEHDLDEACDDAARYDAARNDEARDFPLLALVLDRREDRLFCEPLCRAKRHPNCVGDVSFYGTRELFRRRDACPRWIPVERVRRAVLVLPLEEYCSVSARENRPPDAEAYYYRQEFDPALNAMQPPLAAEIHRLDRQAFADEPRYLLVPRNPERQYFRCRACDRVFEHAQEETLEKETAIVWKRHPAEPDAEIAFCFECQGGGGSGEKMRTRSSSKRARTSAAQFDIFAGDDSDSANVSNESGGQLSKRQQVRYNKLLEVFQPAVQQLLEESTAERPTLDSAEQFAESFLSHFDESTRSMSAKDTQQRFHDIFQNLKRPNNAELRRRIVTGQFPMDQLVSADVKELAPDSLKRKREAEQRRYFEQQVLLLGNAGTTEVLRKTHKGLEVVPDAKPSAPPPSTRDPTLDDQPTILDDQSIEPVAGAAAPLPKIAEVLLQTRQQQQQQQQAALAAETGDCRPAASLARWVNDKAMQSPWLRMAASDVELVPDARDTAAALCDKLLLRSPHLSAEVRKYAAMNRYGGAAAL